MLKTEWAKQFVITVISLLILQYHFSLYDFNYFNCTKRYSECECSRIWENNFFYFFTSVHYSHAPIGGSMCHTMNLLRWEVNDTAHWSEFLHCHHLSLNLTLNKNITCPGDRGLYLKHPFIVFNCFAEKTLEAIMNGLADFMCRGLSNVSLFLFFLFNHPPTPPTSGSRVSPFLFLSSPSNLFIFVVFFGGPLPV